MNTKFLEQYYKAVILPLYGDAITLSGISWKDHGKVGNDTWAHYFDDKNGREYVLLYEDFPGSEYLNDDLTHDIVKCGEDTSIRVEVTPGNAIENVAGYFTLYEEKLDR
jgi:hypothetical protein